MTSKFCTIGWPKKNDQMSVCITNRQSDRGTHPELGGQKKHTKETYIFSNDCFSITLVDPSSKESSDHGLMAQVLTLNAIFHCKITHIALHTLGQFSVTW